MNRNNRIKRVLVVNEQLKKDFYALENGKIDEKELFVFINRAMDDLKENPFCGIRVPSDRWPKEYVKKYKISCLYKYNLPNAWRLIYTINGSEIEVVAILLEWMSHKEYERRFGY